MFVADCYNQTGFEPAINCSYYETAQLRKREYNPKEMWDSWGLGHCKQVAVATRPVLAGRCGSESGGPGKGHETIPLGHVMFHDKRAPRLEKTAGPLDNALGNQRTVHRAAIQSQFRIPITHFRLLGNIGLRHVGGIGDDDIDGAVQLANVAKDVASAISRW